MLIDKDTITSFNIKPNIKLAINTNSLKGELSFLANEKFKTYITEFRLDICKVSLENVEECYFLNLVIEDNKKKTKIYNLASGLSTKELIKLEQFAQEFKKSIERLNYDIVSHLSIKSGININKPDFKKCYLKAFYFNLNVERSLSIIIDAEFKYNKTQSEYLEEQVYDILLNEGFQTIKYS